MNKRYRSCHNACPSDNYWHYSNHLHLRICLRFIKSSSWGWNSTLVYSLQQSSTMSTIIGITQITFTWESAFGSSSQVLEAEIPPWSIHSSSPAQCQQLLAILLKSPSLENLPSVHQVGSTPTINTNDHLFFQNNMCWG